ncbi:MAG: metallophosphoesterase [Microbacteriaceae bacterium]|jgi:predicted MPP superfamily phosphohydrolase|nr:metallophosphoesterase [Microbacteriaceae bacterium]MCI1207667.1 metallophosphoesterase [Microbacteriaceae bacterium]
MTRHPVRTALGAVAGFGLAGAALNLTALHGFRLRQETAPVLPDGWAPIRILHLSDLHLAPWQRTKIRWVRALAGLHPDLVIDTGDNLGHPAAFSALRRALGPLLGVPGVVVDGGNDLWAPRPRNPARYLLGPSRHAPGRRPLDTARLHRLLGSSGWQRLENRATVIHLPQGDLGIIGTGDAHEGRANLSQALATRPELPAGTPWIGVTHAPYLHIVNGLADAGVSMCFAGHTHGGQIHLPGLGALVTNCDLPRPFASGMHHWNSPEGAETTLEISAGLGTSIYAPVRVFCPPEAVLLTLTASTRTG